MSADFEIHLVQPDPRRAIVVERIVPGTEPDYCAHGQVRCVHCDWWCWLGSASVQVVKSGKATPLCIECAILAGITSGQYAGRVRDH